MPTDADLARRLREAEARLRSLQTENEELAELQVDATLLGMVSEALALEDDPDAIVRRALEAISVLKDLPCCALAVQEGEVLGLRLVYLARTDDSAAPPSIRLTPGAAEALRAGAVVLDEASCAAFGLGEAGLGRCAARAAVLLPFTCRIWPRGVLLFADERPRDLHGAMPVLARLAESIAGRLENVALLRELKALTEALDQKVADRTRALSGALEELEREMAERQRAEAALLQSQKLEAVGQLAGGLAHDFNNLLTTIVGTAELVLDDVPAGSRTAEDVRTILSASDHAAALTRQLLAFSRRQQLETTALRLEELCRAFSPMLGRLLGELVEVRLAISPGAPPILGDRSQLEQVLLNLAVNARDAMPEGGTLRLEVAGERVEAAGGVPPPGEWVRLSVADTGSGMTPEVAARAFEPFFTTKERGRGTGLGLATVHGVVQQHGGHLRLTTAPGQGTRFDVFLPAMARVGGRAPTPVAARTGVGAPAGAPPGNGELVLVVDDDAEVRRTAGAMLQRLGYRVLEARGGEEAMAVATQAGGEVAVLLSDVIMPGLRGPELAVEFRRAWPGRAVVLMSGYLDDTPASSRRADAFLSKPLTSGALAQALRAALAKAAGP